MLPVLVGLLDAADAVLETRRCPARPTAGPASRGRAGRAGTCRSSPAPLGSVANSTRQVGQLVDGRAPATARSRWRGSRRTAGTPACGRSARCAPPRPRRRSSRRATAAATTGTGASPLRPNIACSRSDCSVLVGRPVDGPPRWMSQMTSGSSSDTARPIVSPLSAMPGPGRRGDGRARRRTPRRARRRCRRSRPRPGRCARRSACAWTARAGCRLAGVIGYAPRNSGSSRALRRRDQPVGQRQVAADVAVGAGRQRGRLDLVGDARTPRSSRRSSSRP